MDISSPPGATDKEAAEWKAAKKKQNQADNPLTVREVTTDGSGNIISRFFQKGKRDPIWTINTTPEQPKWTLSGALKGKTSEPPPKP